MKKLNLIFGRLYEKLTANTRLMGYISITFSIIAIAGIIGFCITFGLNAANYVWFIIAIISMYFSLSFIMIYKNSQLRTALKMSEILVKKLEEENMDYKKYTDVLLNDKDIRELLVKKSNGNQ